MKTGEWSSDQRPRITSINPRRNGLSTAARETLRQKRSKAARAPSAPPAACPSASTAPFIAPAEVPEIPKGKILIQVIAKNYQTFGQTFDIAEDEKTIEVTLKPPRVPFQETIRHAAKAHGRHKKQSGGRGQFGDCEIEIEPLRPGMGFEFEFVDQIKGGAIRLSATAYGTRSFPARLLSMGAMVDPQTRTVPLLAQTDNKEGLLKPGMFVRILLDSPTTERALTRSPLESVRRKRRWSGSSAL